MKKTLKELGLTDKEIAVYLTLLAVGSTTASILAYKTSISPSTIHYLCDRLKAKGLLESFRKGNTIYYAPEPPEKMLYLLEQAKCEILHKQEAVHRILGELKALMNPEGKFPKVRFRQGTEGMLQAYREFFEALEEEGGYLYHFINPLYKTLGKSSRELIELFTQAKAKKKFLYQCILVESSFGHELQKQIHSSDAEILFIQRDPEKHQHYYASLLGPRMVLDVNYSEHEVLSTSIQHEGVAQMRQELFELAWQEAKRQQGKQELRTRN